MPDKMGDMGTGGRNAASAGGVADIAGAARVFLVVGLAYAAGSQLAYSWFGADGTSASFFPAAGVTMSALLIVPMAQWPLVLAAAGVAELSVDSLHGIGAVPSLGYVVANLLQPLVGALLVRRFSRGVDLGRSRELAAFLGLAVVVGPAVGGVLGASTFVFLDGGTGWARFAGEWWVGDGLGVLVVGGAVLALRLSSWRSTSGLRTAEAVVLVAATAILTFAVFDLGLLGAVYVPIALMVAVAFRVGTRGVAVAGAAMAFIAAQATATGHQLWDDLQVPAPTGLLYLQLALAVIIATALALAAEINEQEKAALAWANAEAARRESSAAAERSERLRSLAEDLATSLTTADVERTFDAHGFHAAALASDDRFLHDAAAPMAQQALERARLHEAERRARTQSELLERHAAQLTAAATMAEVAQVTVQELDHMGVRTASVRLVDGDVIRVVAAAGAPRGMLERYAAVPHREDPSPAADVIRTGRVVHLGTADAIDAAYPRVRELRRAVAAETVLVHPLRGADQAVLGVLSVTSTEPHRFEADSRDVITAMAEQCGLALDRARLLGEERRARARVERLQSLTAALASAATQDEVCDVLVREAVAALGARSGFVRLAGSTAGEAPPEASPPVPGPSSLSVPLADAGGRQLGLLVIDFGDAEAPTATSDDLSLVAAIAGQAAATLERAKLLEQAIDAGQRAAFLARYSAALAQPTDTAARARRSVRLLAAGPARHASVHLLDEELRPACLAHAGHGPVDDAGVAGLVEAVLGSGEARTAGTVTALALRARDRVIGVLVAEWGPELSQRPDDQREIAARTALAIDDARQYEQERHASHTLQRGLLGGPLHQPDGIGLAAAYRPGTEALEVGGDWYDSFPLPTGRVAVVVGDVVGHSLEAAVAMGHLRGAVRALAPLGSPSQLLERLDRFVAGLPAAALATVAYLDLDPVTGAVGYACAGHPPPLLARADGSARYLWGGRSTPLGLGHPGGRPEAVAVLSAGDHLAVYTDGLVEKRRTSLDDGLAALRLAFRPGPGRSPTALVDDTLHAMLDGGVQQDDVCLVVATATPTVRVMACPLGGPADLAPLRRLLRTWMDGLGVEDAIRDDVILAVGEAAANALEHGAVSTPAADAQPVTVEGTLDSGRLLVVIRDSGTWLDRPSAPDRGRGTGIMRELMDAVTVETTIGGTEVMLERHLGTTSDGSAPRQSEHHGAM